MNRRDCAHRRTPGNCEWEWCLNAAPKRRIVLMSREEAEELMSYVESSKYESETEIQKTDRLIGELSSQVESLKALRKSLINKRNLDLLDKVGDRVVIRFAKVYNPGGPAYHYAAIKSGNWWYVTSNGFENRKTTEELKDFIGGNPVEIMVPNKEL